MFLMYRLPFVECLMFGSLISATDPVTVLSIFQVLSFTAIRGYIHYFFNDSSFQPLLTTVFFGRNLVQM